MTRPTITSPVSRHLSVADLERSLAFYRDLLGFESRPVSPGDGVPAVAEVVRGPARIQLTTEEGAWNSTGERRLRGSAVLFFETDDVATMREEVRTNGGAPSEVEKANWIKMRLFQIADPDGHILWFAQTFQEPDQERPEPMMREALPQLPLTDVAAGIKYYCDVLGFSINYAQNDVGVMFRDDITILLIQRTERYTGIGSFSAYIRDADVLHAEMVAKGAKVLSEPVSRPWGLRDFSVLDLEGNQITFCQTFE